MNKKNKTTVILLALFFGVFGVHRFYLGQTGKGIVYIIITPFISWLFALIDFFGFVFMSDEVFDRKYNPWLYTRNDGGQGNRNYVNYQRNAASNLNQQQRFQQEDKYEKVLRAVQAIQKDIERMIEKSSMYDNQIVADIKSMMENYIKQVKQLIERDKKLQVVAKSYTIEEVDKLIKNLEVKLQTATSEYLRKEYNKNLTKYREHRKSYQDLQEQREVIRMRVNSSIMSLKQIKLDLIKMENMASYEERDNFFKTFDEKSQDLSNYLDFLETSYNQ